MVRFAFILLAATAAFAADDPWAKIKDLKSGTEVRLFRNHSPKPVEGNFYEVRESDLVLVIKNEQVAVPKDQIDRIDARAAKVSRTGIATETTTKAGEDPNAKPPAGMAHGAPTSGTAYSTTTTIGSKPPYETVYRRPPATAPAKSTAKAPAK